MNNQIFPTKKGQRGLNVTLKGEEFPEVKSPELTELAEFCHFSPVPQPSKCHQELLKRPENIKEVVLERFEFRDVEKEDLLEPGHIIDYEEEYQVPQTASISISVFSSCVSPSTDDIVTMSHILFQLKEKALESHQDKQKWYSIRITSTVKDQDDPVQSISRSESFKINDKNGQHAFLVHLLNEEQLLNFKCKYLTIEYEVTVSSCSF